MATLPTGSSNFWSDVSANGGMVAIFEWDSGELTIYDTSTWQPITSFAPGNNRGVSLSPDGSKILTAGTDGYVRIWDTHAGTELLRIPLPGASDGYWLDEVHIVIGAATGLWTTITLDLEELKDLALSRLTRGFTAEECETYRIDPCHDLATIQSKYPSFDRSKLCAGFWLLRLVINHGLDEWGRPALGPADQATAEELNACHRGANEAISS